MALGGVDERSKSRKRLAIQSQYQEQATKQTVKTAQPIDPKSLTTAVADIYVTSEENDFLVMHLAAANVTSADATYNLYFVPDGGTAGTANAVIFESTLAANTSEVVAVAVNHRIPAGAKMQALCSVDNAINLVGWGFDQGSEE